MSDKTKDYITGAILGLIISALVYWAVYVATV